MQRTVIILVAIVAIAAVIYSLTRPEPTPAERLSEAAQNVGEAAQDAVDEIAKVADETVDAVKTEAAKKAEDLQAEAAKTVEALSAELTATSENAQQELESFVQEWQETGIVTEEGIDFDAAIAAVDSADMDAETKLEINKILIFLRDLPGAATEKLEALETAL